jgi:hypothetical protein
MFSFFNKSDKDTATTEAQASTQVSNTDVREKWKALAAARKITSSDIAALCIYRSVLRGEGAAGAESRLRKSFFPITNQVKLDNGAAPFGSLKNALGLSRYSTFFSWLTPSEQESMQNIAQELYKSGVFK